MLFRATYSKNERAKSWFRSQSRFLYLNEILYNSELFEKSVGMMNFVILDTYSIDLALDRFCLGSWNYPA